MMAAMPKALPTVMPAMEPALIVVDDSMVAPGATAVGTAVGLVGAVVGAGVGAKVGERSTTVGGSTVMASPGKAACSALVMDARLLLLPSVAARAAPLVPPLPPGAVTV